MQNFRKLIETNYLINSYINLFRLAEDSKILQVIINDKVRKKTKLYLASIDLDALKINENYGIKQSTKLYWLQNLEKLPISLIKDIIISWHVNNKSSESEFLEDVEFFLKNFEFFVCKGSFITKIPNKPSKDMLYLTGIIMGDGSLPIRYNGSRGRQYEVVVEKANKKFIFKTVRPLFAQIFGIETKISKNYKHDKIRYRCYFKSRIVYAFLNKILDVPAGKKSSSIKFPSILKDLTLSFKLALFAGLVDTDWGRQRWIHFGTHMASELLSKDYKNLLNSLGMELRVKKYSQRDKFISYQCYLRRGDEQKLFSILNEHYPLRNTKRIKLLNAGVAESGKCASMSKSSNI